MSWHCLLLHNIEGKTRIGWIEGFLENTSTYYLRDNLIFNKKKKNHYTSSISQNIMKKKISKNKYTIQNCFFSIEIRLVYNNLYMWLNILLLAFSWLLKRKTQRFFFYSKLNLKSICILKRIEIKLYLIKYIYEMQREYHSKKGERFLSSKMCILN